MRNIKKTITVQTIERTYYDRAAKLEKTETINKPDFAETPAAAPGCHILEDKLISTQEVTYSMSPETFFKYATVAAPDKAE